MDSSPTLQNPGPENLAGIVAKLNRSFRLVGVLRFRSVTPLWPGGFNAKTFHCGSNGCLGPFYPEAKQLIGRARWLARALAGEASAARIFGSTEAASPYQVIARWSHSCDSGNPGLLDWDAAKSYESIIKKVVSRNLGVHHGISALSIMGYRYLRELMGVKSGNAIKIVGKVREALRVAEKEVRQATSKSLGNLLLLFTIPRFLIAVQGVADATRLYEMQPLKPCLTLEVEVYRRLGAERSRDLDEAVLTLLALTPIVAGLGKSVTRGFGRFTLEEADPQPEPVRGLLGLGGVGVAEASQRLASALQQAAELLARVAGRTEHPGLHRIEEPGKALAAIERLRHPFPYSLYEAEQAVQYRLPGTPQGGKTYCDSITEEVKRTLCALSAIGAATVKLTWKIYHYASKGADKGITRRSGATLHTWPLGLPRSAGKKKKTGYLILSVKEKGEKEWSEGRFQSPTHIWPHTNGYTLLSLTPSHHITELNTKGYTKLQSRTIHLYHVGSRRQRVDKLNVAPPPPKPEDKTMNRITVAREWILYLLNP